MQALENQVKQLRQNAENQKRKIASITTGTESGGCKSKHAYESHNNDSDSDDEIDTDYLWYSKEAEPGSRIIEAQEQQHDTKKVQLNVWLFIHEIHWQAVVAPHVGCYQ